MTPSKRSELTISVLQKLRRSGAPKSRVPELDMGFGDEAELPDEELSMDGSEVGSGSEFLKHLSKKNRKPAKKQVPEDSY